ncbi:unnamed protein product [Hermetia illucens]|uniref:Potassium channel domain-containing protein n=1 Tax=Hermetia illucens TaxID=343691 RepID=A0A7R8UU10_HERIL|nr:unnamed protein product [Hermetia illucens]
MKVNQWSLFGYGGISPRTQWGRIAALLYALFGIPIVLLYLSAMGEGLSAGMRCLFRKASRSRSKNGKSSNKTPPSDGNAQSVGGSVAGIAPHISTQYSSLPRRSSAFQRNTPVRRSTGIMENHFEYFVPRSVSEFNLSGVGDLAIIPPRRSSPPITHNIQSQTILCPPTQMMMKPREKMVTFEDESSSSSKCPHGMPTTPRKVAPGPAGGADVFM